MMKLVVLYSPPSDVAAFDEHYLGVHVPLVQGLPDLARFETAVGVATPDGSPVPYHRMAELYYDSADLMGPSLSSEQGRRTAKDAQELAGRTGSTVTMLVCAVD